MSMAVKEFSLFKSIAESGTIQPYNAYNKICLAHNKRFTHSINPWSCTKATPKLPLSKTKELS